MEVLNEYKYNMPNYDEPKGRGNKKSDKAKKNFDLHGKNTQRGVRFMESVLNKHSSNKTCLPASAPKI